MPQALTLTIGTICISASALFLRKSKDDAPFLLFLYVGVMAGFLAWLSLPFIDLQTGTANEVTGLAASP